MKKSTKILSLIVELLKQDSRISILEMSRQIGVPKSTVYDHYRKLRERYWFTVVEKFDERPNSLTSAKTLNSSSAKLNQIN